MKHYLLTILFSIICNCVFAQSINMPNIPTSGITINYDQIDELVSFENTPPWDFSNTNVTSEYSMSVLPIDSSTSAADYPNSTHVLKSANGEFFLGISSQSYSSFGKIGSSTTTNYSTPLILINYPFDSSVAHADSIESTVLWNELTAPATDKIEINGISSGSVTMPDGTMYENAILVNTKRTTVYGPSPFNTFLTIEEISHQWWIQDYPTPAIEILEAYSNETLVFSRTLFMKSGKTYLETFSSKERKLEKIIDFEGKTTNFKQNKPLIYLYNDGSIEKKIVTE